MIFRGQDRCTFCAHYTQAQTCLAFPNGIPEAVWAGDVYHDQAIDGDHGFRYESRHLHFPDAEAFMSGNY